MSLCPEAVRCSGSPRPRRSRWSSSIRARMAAKSSAARIAISFPQFYGVNAHYPAWFRRLGRDLALQNCRSRARLRVCQRRWELWSPLLRLRWAEAGGGMRSRPAASLLHPFASHRISRAGAKLGHLPGQCPVAAWTGNQPLHRRVMPNRGKPPPD
jgi:hypothetical protein